MASLAIIVEGHGEDEAAPALIRLVLGFLNRYDHYDLYNNIEPLNAKGRENIVVEGGLEKFLNIARKIPDCAGIIVLLDVEKKEVCPLDLAQSLSLRATQMGLKVPVVIVCAVCEYESWFLASMDKIAGRHDIPAGTKFIGNPEEKCNAKEWLTDQMPPGKIYKETTHQAKMTFDLDLDHLAATIRSFRRLIHATEELIEAIDSGETIITPQ